MGEIKKNTILDVRRCGVLMHITSLPSSYGIGDLGPESYAFVDLLAQMKQAYWQVLPLNPTDGAFGNSPYSSISAFAGNTLLLSPEVLVRDGLLSESACASCPDFSLDHVEFAEVTKYKNTLFEQAFAVFCKKRDVHSFDTFCSDNASWLDDYALFCALKDEYGEAVWREWPQEIRDRNPQALSAAHTRHSDKVRKEKFLQFLFFSQWLALRTYANEKGVHVIGDMPIYVNYDSVDVWAHTHIFKLDDEKKPQCVAGVPPDYFSETGQLWGNPVYDWEALKKEKYAWWVQRLKESAALFDVVRIDHFRGLVAYWEVDAHEETAMNGSWAPVPVDDLFRTITAEVPSLTVIAEDLGVITDDVRAVMKRFNFPGMKVLLFAFEDDMATNPYIPHNHYKHAVVYTGTHDNNTIVGWFDHDASEKNIKQLSHYLGHDVSRVTVKNDMLRLALQSVAHTVIIPLADIFGLASNARMNKPATGENNWQWRVTKELYQRHHIQEFTDIAQAAGRIPEN